MNNVMLSLKFIWSENGMWHEQEFWIDIICLWIFSVFLEVKWAHCTFVNLLCMNNYLFENTYFNEFFFNHFFFLGGWFVRKFKLILNEFYVLVFCNRTKVSSQPRFYVFLFPITKLKKNHDLPFKHITPITYVNSNMAWIIFLYVLLILTSLKSSKSSWFARFEVFFAFVNVALSFPSWLCVFVNWCH